MSQCESARPVKRDPRLPRALRGNDGRRVRGRAREPLVSVSRRTGARALGTGERLGLIGFAALTLSVASCGISGGGAEGTPFPTRIQLPAGRVPLPDHEPCRAAGDAPCADAGYALFGVLHEAEGCVWYVLENGTEVRVVWPFGYSAQHDPFIVYDNAGREVARNGDSLQADGTGPVDGETDACGRSKYVTLVDPVMMVSPRPTDG